MPLNLTIREGEQWAVIGPNGAGKSVLADILVGRYALKDGEVRFPTGANVKSIAFKDIYSLADYRNAYYQQRWHSTETDEIPTVEQSLFSKLPDTAYLSELLSLFDIVDLLPKRLIFLSSGELRKFLIVRVLLTRPQLLIMDNPFIGLDAGSRVVLTDMISRMTALRGLQIILLLSNPDDLPPMVTHVLPVYRKKLYPATTREAFQEDKQLLSLLFPDNSHEITLPAATPGKADYQTIFRMEHVSIRYGERNILNDLNWEVKKGEKWALLGANGSGKSTLLSLVFADNPQAYANTICLFDRKRGSGESIWDIKKRIGYVSPEIHLYYRENVPAQAVVGSGFFDAIGLFRKCNDEQQAVALQWMETFGIAHLKERLFLTLSSGEQRLVLLARAFVKNPDLLILDEPLHGLDISNKRKVIQLVEQFCSLPDKTLIYVTHYPHELPPCVSKRFELIKQNP
jgi:molybdate transport system ATP-binding protein